MRVEGGHKILWERYFSYAKILSRQFASLILQSTVI